MGISCDCSCDCDEPWQCYTQTIRRARKEHRCSECGDTIVPGERYEEYKGIDYESDPFLHRTCLPCARIREHYCPDGWWVGGLADQIEPCIGFDYREVPRDGPHDPMFDGDVALAAKGGG